MRRLTFAITLIIVASAFGKSQTGGQAETQDAKAEQEVRALRKALLDAGRRNDRAALESMIADGFTFTHATGNLETKKQWIDNAVATTQGPSRTTEYPEDQVRVYEGRTAVWTTRSILRAQGAGTEINLRSTNTYVKIGGRWQWAAGQSTRLPSRPKAAAIDRRLYSGYIGQYEISAGRALTVTEDGETLRGQVTGLPPAELIPRSETEFIWFNPDLNLYSEIIFIKAEGGGVTHAGFRREGIDIWRAKKIK
jgi:hypothetical protein